MARHSVTQRRTVTFTEPAIKMIEDLMHRKGYRSVPQLIHQAIVEMHNRTFPAYSIGKQSAKEMLEIKRTEEEMKKTAELEAQKKICKDLEGTIVGDVCHYYTYLSTKRFPNKVSLNLLTERMVETQYQPNKQRVLKYQEDGKTNYEDQ